MPTARFRVFYALRLIEIGSRHIIDCGGTEPPTTDGTLQPFRKTIPSDPAYRFLIHHRDSIFSAQVDERLQAFGLKTLRSPVKRQRPTPTASG